MHWLSSLTNVATMLPRRGAILADARGCQQTLEQAEVGDSQKLGAKSLTPSPSWKFP